ncbi:probable peroxisomal acyl-coenzyme A oxidase 1 [Scaptodrosophila lebanonensis]|uniref:Acyl-coenzyme A oxidase n=1 Tax=Drosophila lebanonensis TaxID=7225 RepID=A0A6J2T3W0_DROLE|nr:probable peroxisomal acyl-coenzyme A oxidase 1 [Scaptodrosophila lebanonensis]
MSIPSAVNPDLVKERQNATFDVDEFASWFYGDTALMGMKRLITEELYRGLDDPLDLEYMSYEDVYTAGVKQAVESTVRMRNMQEKINPGGTEIYPTLLSGLVGNAMMPAGNPMAVHLLMFTKALKGQGTSEQYERWGKRADNFEIIGTYAQTELGHGTYLRGLQTRADYDRRTDEFVLHTPHISAYKWWPGGLGHTVNYCIVVAQLYIDGESKGIHLFLVQVRDEETHRPLPGIDIGDIGKKIGMPGVNNGYLGLNKVRIPRIQMLMRNAQVLEDGSYVKSPVSQLNYFPMVYVRAAVAFGNTFFLAQAVTIATRYSAVRRQSPINEPEPQVLDHITQQMKVLPEIASVVAYRLAAGQVWSLYHRTAKDVNAGDYSRLPELHALSCTLKAACSYDSTYAIERMRQSCGGHGYLAAANLGNIFGLASAACTYEGENSVLYLQVGKILLKAWGDVLAKRQLMPTMSYLGELAAWKQFPQWTGSWQQLVEALQYAATNKTRLAHQHYTTRLGAGRTQPQALNETGIELTQAAELHGRAFVTYTFLQEVTGKAAAKRSANLNRVLEQLLELYLVHTVQRHMADILRFVPLSEQQIDDLQTRLELVLKQVRLNAVAIVDGFDLEDRELSSVLGSYDGNVYERILASAKKSPMNKRPVPVAFERYLKPFMRAKL